MVKKTQLYNPDANAHNLIKEHRFTFIPGGKRMNFDPVIDISYQASDFLYIQVPNAGQCLGN